MRLLEATTIEGASGHHYPIKMYPADMRFNDFIAGIYILFAGDRTLFAGHSDNIDLVLQKKQVANNVPELSTIGLIRMGNPDKRQAILDDLALAPELSEI